MKQRKDQKSGFGLVEIVVAVAIVGITFFALAGVSQTALRVVRQSTENARANFLLEEGLEAIRSLRDASWSSNIASTTIGAPHYPIYDSILNSWGLSTTNPGPIDGLFTRTITLNDVYRRNSDDDIVSATSTEPKTIDPGTRQVTITVSWGRTTVTSNEVSVSFEDGTTDGDLGNFPSNNAGNGDPAQSFTTPTNSIAVSQVALYLKRATTDPSDIFLTLRETSTVGTVLATSQTIDSAALPSSLSWTIFTFPDAVTLDPDTQYFLRISSTPPSTDAFSGSTGTIHWGYQQTGPSPYAGGQAYRYVGRLSNPSDTGQPLSQYDFAFRVYEETTSGSTGHQIKLITYLADIFQN